MAAVILRVVVARAAALRDTSRLIANVAAVEWCANGG